MHLGRSLTALATAAMIAAAAGCGSDDSGQTTTTGEVSIPSPTSPLPPPATTTTAQGTGKKKGGQTTTGSGGSAPCTIPDAFQDFKFTGLDCSAAVAVASAWDQNGDRCNTVDNPNVDAGYRRTCSVEGFTCDAKRDVRSDGRFVTCTQGGQNIRFTWLPA